MTVKYRVDRYLERARLAYLERKFKKKGWRHDEIYNHLAPAFFLPQKMHYKPLVDWPKRKSPEVGFPYRPVCASLHDAHRNHNHSITIGPSAA